MPKTDQQPAPAPELQVPAALRLLIEAEERLSWTVNDLIGRLQGVTIQAPESTTAAVTSDDQVGLAGAILANADALNQLNARVNHVITHLQL